jgi:hypothetical protein
MNALRFGGLRNLNSGPHQLGLMKPSHVGNHSTQPIARRKAHFVFERLVRFGPVLSIEIEPGRRPRRRHPGRRPRRRHPVGRPFPLGIWGEVLAAPLGRPGAARDSSVKAGCQRTLAVRGVVPLVIWIRVQAPRAGPGRSTASPAGEARANTAPAMEAALLVLLVSADKIFDVLEALNLLLRVVLKTLVLLLRGGSVGSKAVPDADSLLVIRGQAPRAGPGRSTASPAR